ncbi:gfo/Idh/MocA family oxidoreductase [candidate division KSB1 bacterium]|nr:Gfo/Idh/MocA family oxidoreductase [candidate division KSB1 bacterium]RQW05562.1 MAG: gfo/Idh/MocA family oxidoreductase [candidate division KSB1 bacterium]
MNPTRREFAKTSVLATAAVAGAPAVLRGRSLNDKIRVGFIGVGNRGSQLLGLFRDNADVDIAALCDVYEPFVLRDYSLVDKRFIASVGGRIPRMGEQLAPYARVKDFRQLLVDKSIDAVCIATPDHWHAIQTIMACQAGKDVYCEKPLTMTIKEGRRMVDVAQETNRIVAVGLNRRGSTLYQHLVKEVQGGKIGRVSVALAGRVSNMFPDGIGTYQPTEPPADFDWDLWLGPRNTRPFQFNIAPYKFRWWSDYSSQMGNWGVHYIDVIRWMIDETAPLAVTSHGSRSLIDDDADIPDTMEVLFEFKSGAILKFSVNEACSGDIIPGHEVELRGTKGNIRAREYSYTVTAADPGQFQTWDKQDIEQQVTLADLLGDPEKREDSTANLVCNFLDCVKSRQTPFCPVEEGHRSTLFALMANIALARQKRLKWDAEKEMFTNDDAANDLLHYEYRSPWTLG